MPPAGIQRARPQVDAGALLPGRQSRLGLGRHRHHRAAVDRRGVRRRSTARPGLRLLMVSTTGEDAAWFVLDDELVPRPAEMPARGARASSSASARTASRRSATVLFVAGAGGSLRAGVTENPVRADALDQGAARQRHLRRRAGLRLAGRRHHGDGRRRDACRPTPSARCRRRRSSRRSSSRCASTTTARSAATWTACAALDDVTRRRRLARHRRRAGRAVAARRAARSGAMSARAQPAPCGCRLDVERWHFQHGPIDCIVAAEGDDGRQPSAIERAERASGRCSTSSSASCRCCAPISRPARRRRCRAARWRGAWSPRAGRTPTTAASSPRWPRSPAASPRSCSRRLRRSAHRPRLDQQRRRHRACDCCRATSLRRRRLRRSGPRPPRRCRSTAASRHRRGVAGARHRHLGLARRAAFARHRRQRHRARGDARRSPTRRRRSSPTRSTSTIARIVRAPASAVARRQRPRRPPRHARRCRRCPTRSSRWRSRAAPTRRARRSPPGASSPPCSRCKRALVA